MAQYVAIQPIDAVIGGIEVTMPLTYVELRDFASGYDGPGSYHIQLSRGGVLGARYIATVGLPPCDSATLMTVLRVVQTPDGQLVFKDARKLNVGNTGVNATIMQTANADGSYLAAGVVTVRTIKAGTITALLDQLGATRGDILYRGASGWTVLTPGTLGYVLATGGPGADPSWVAAGGGGGGITAYGSSFPGSPVDKELFYRTDLNALFVYLSSSPGPAWFNVDSLAQLQDVSLTSPADDDLLTYDSGTSKWINASLSALIDDVFSSTRGAILYRGASSWVALGPGSAGQVLETGGAGADPSWTTIGGGSGGGWTSVAFNSTAYSTNFNPEGHTASSLFKSTASIPGLSAPTVLRIRALVRYHSTGSNSYFGIAVSADGTNFFVLDTTPIGGGYAELFEGTISAVTVGSASIGSGFPATAGQVSFLEMMCSVAGSTLVIVGGNAGGSTFGRPFIATPSNVDLTSAFYIYAIGAASSDVIACSYSVGLAP